MGLVRTTTILEDFLLVIQTLGTFSHNFDSGYFFFLVNFDVRAFYFSG